MHLDWKVWLYVRPPNLKSNISNVLEHHIWNVSKYLKYLGSLIWRCLVKKCFNIKHFKDINFFQSFASIGRVDLVYWSYPNPMYVFYGLQSWYVVWTWRSKVINKTGEGEWKVSSPSGDLFAFNQNGIQFKQWIKGNCEAHTKLYKNKIKSYKHIFLWNWDNLRFNANNSQPT